MLCFAVYAFAVCLACCTYVFSLMRTWWYICVQFTYDWENVCMLWCLYIGFRLCDCLHEHIWMRASDRTTRGFCLCDYPVYAKENICHAFHSCVPRCMSVWLCLRTGRLTVWLRQILLDLYWVGVCLCDFAWCLSVWLHLPCVAFLVRVRIFLCGFAYPTTLRGEVNIPENHACDEPVIGCHTHCRSLH